MAKVFISTIVDAPLARVWAVVRDFNGLPSWTPFAVESRIEQNARPDQIGCIRNFRLAAGGVIRERLLALSDYDFSMTYSILESPMAVEDYVATLKLLPVTDGERSYVEWSAEFDCRTEDEQKLIGLDRPRYLPCRAARPAKPLRASMNPVVRVLRSTVVDAPVDTLWRLLRDFNSHENWHPAIAGQSYRRRTARRRRRLGARLPPRRRLRVARAAHRAFGSRLHPDLLPARSADTACRLRGDHAAEARHRRRSRAADLGVALPPAG